jgi:hypothetical protein
MAMYKFILTVLAIVAAGSAVDVDPGRYSGCSSDRGYHTDDALVAGQAIYKELIPQSGLRMEKKDCIYRHHNTTVVSLCNGSGRDRTVVPSEAQRAFEQLIKDCGADGSFSGFHVVNNLTIAAYGTAGAIKTVSGGRPVDIPGGRLRRLNKRLFDSDDPCANIPWDGTLHLGCKNKSTRNGEHCNVGPDSAYVCQSYCEDTRSVFLGPEQPVTNFPGLPDGIAPAGQKVDLAISNTVGVSIGFDIGAEGVIKELFGLGVGFAWSRDISTSYGATINGVEDPPNRTQWVFFPLLVETCGIVTKETYISPSTPICPGCASTPAGCLGDPSTVRGVCSMTPVKGSDGTAQGWYAQRYLDSNNNPLPIAQQTKSYTDVCNTVNNDGRPEWSCAAPA